MDQPLQNSLAEVVRVLRALRGLSQAELAERSGLSDVYLRQIEKGERDIGIGALQKLASGLGCQPGDLLPASHLSALDRFIAIAHREAPAPAQHAVLFLLSTAEDPVRKEALLTLMGSYVILPRPRRGRPPKSASLDEAQPPARPKRQRKR